jgi:autotransporter-associated beta strand protein
MKTPTTYSTYAKAVITAASICASLCLAANSAKAATSLYFDSNGTAAGYGSGGSWDGSNWATATGGTTATGPWGPGDFARFNTAASSIVTVGADESMAGLFNTVSAATLTINQSSGSGQLDITTAGGTPVSGGLVQGFLCTGPVVVNAPIVGSGGIQPQLGALSLFGNNTYSGGTYLGSSIVNFNNNNAFGTGPITPGVTGGTSISPGYCGVLSQGGSLITLPNNIVITNAFCGINFGSSANTPVNCTGNWNLQQTLYVKNNGNPTAPLTLSGVLSGPGGLNVSGNNLGTIIISGPNTFTGPVALGQIGASSNITLSVSSINSVTTPTPQLSSSLGAPSSAVNGIISMGSLTNAGILIYTGIGETSDRVINLAGTTGGATIENDGSGPLVFTSSLTATTNGVKTLTLRGSNTGANTIAAIVDSSSGATSVTKAQSGTWVLSGANSYTGGTTVSAGTLLVDGSVASGSAVTVASATILGGNGTINGTVNASAGAILSPGDPASSSGVGTLTLANNSATSLTLNGNTIKCDLSATAGISDSIAISGTLVLNGANYITLSTPLGTAPAGTYTLMTYAAQTGTGTLALDQAYPNATLTVGAASVTLTIAGSGTAGTLTWLGDGSANAWNTAATGDWLNGVTVATYADGSSVLFDDTSTNNSININSGTVLPALVEVNTSSKNYTITGSGIGGTASVTKYGSSTLTLPSANTYSGATTIAGGTISVASLNYVTSGTLNPNTSSGLGAPTSVANGTVSIGSANVGGTLTYTGTGETSDRVINLAGTTGGTTLNQSGTGLLKFSSALTATGAGAKTLTLQGSTAGTAEFAGAIVDSGSGASSVTKSGTGAWTLSGPNTYSGATTINGGILSVASLNFITSGTLSPNTSSSLGVPTTAANGTIGIGSSGTAGTLTYTGLGETSDRVINLAGTTGGSTIEADGTGPLVLSSAFTATGAGIKTLTLQGSSTGANTIGGAIVNNSGANLTSLTKAQAGTWVLSGANTYAGATAIQNGTLSVSSLNKVTGGVASSSLGAPATAANGTIGFGATTTTGKLVYTGAGETSDRVVNLAGTTGGATIENDGSGAVVFSSACTATGNGAKTLTLQGSYTATANSIGAIPNGASSSKTSVTVAGGHWAITGASGYTGITTINAGTLTLSNTISSPTITVAGGATFDLTGLLPTVLTLSAQTVSNSSSTAVLNGSLNLGTATASMTYAAGTPSFMVANGTVTLANNSVIKVNNTGPALTHGSYKIISAGTGGSVAFASTAPGVTVSGGGIATGATASLTITSGELYLVVIQPPTIANPVVTENATAGSIWKIAITSLATAAGWSDPNGFTITLSSVGPTSFNGTNVTSDANYIYYNGAVTAADHFGYTITNGTLTASGTVNLVPVSVPSPNIVSPTINGSGNPTFSGNGIPGYVYGVESATSLTGPWIEAGTVTPDSSGAWSFTDLTQTNPSQIYYRLYFPDDPSNPPQ